MAEQNGGGVHSKGSSTLKQKIKKRLGSSPTVARKGSNVSDLNSVDVGGATGRRLIKVKHPDRRELETSEKSVNAAVQYMNIYCAQEQELDINQIPVLTEAIVSEVKKLLDVAESLTRDSTTGSMDQRQNLLLALARLVSWADKCYMSEDRSSTSTDPSSYLGKLSTAVKELVRIVETIHNGKGRNDSSGDSTPTSTMALRDRTRHRSVPVISGIPLRSPERATPPSPMPPACMTGSYSAENVSESELYRRIPISGSEGHLSVLTESQRSMVPQAVSLANQYPAGSVTPPPVSRFNRRHHQTSPLAKRKSDSAFRFSTDSEVDESPSETTSLTLSSHVAEDDEPEDKPPLPPKKRNSLGYAVVPFETQTSTTSAPPDFMPAYADERVKLQHGLGVGDPPPALRKRYTTGVLPDVSSAAFRRQQQHADSIPKGPMKATHLMGGGSAAAAAAAASAAGPAIPNGFAAATNFGSFQENLTRQIESSSYTPPLVVAAVPAPDQLPPKKPPKTPRPLSCQDPSSDRSTTPSEARSSFVSDISSPPLSLALLPESPPPKPSRTPTGRPQKPPRPSTPVLVVDEPPPLPVKQKQAVREYNALFGPYEGADDEYNRPLIISRPDVRYDVVKQQIAYGSDAVPTPMLQSGRNRSETVAGDVLPPLPEKQSRKKRSRALSCEQDGPIELELELEEDTRLRSRRSRSDPSILETTPSSEDVRTSDGSDLGVPDNPIYSQNVKDLLLFNEEDGGGASLKGGTVDALIAYAAAASASGPDRLYYEAFLMTYRTFVSSETVVEKLLERHDYFLRKRDPVVCHHTLSVLMRVVDDLRGAVNKALLSRLVDVVYRLICDGELKLATVLRRSLIQKWKNLHEPRVSPMGYLTTKPDPNARQKKLQDLKSRQIAEQMSLLDFKFFQNIETPEMLAWAEEQNEEKNPTLTAFTEHFNNVSSWCRTKLIESSDAKDRDKVAHKLIKVMKHLREMNNFNSYLAILSAFDAAAISRLEWSDEVDKGLTEPRALIDNKASFKAYRTALREAKMPCIPYIGMFLQDLTFIHLGNPGSVNNDKSSVNFNKRWRQFTVLEKIRKCQQSEYPFQRDEVIVRVFNGFRPYLGEEQLYQRSLKIKPRDF
ncbi:rap guanine nucleotide exchange factor 1-like isoform X2 [Oscarella lobularis]|uniref:rap guanine nucleotide exchange factor 1-like isoform X2 n=1 Tax=Oscarella lobularis TaxID=121494 RepID=UPI003313149C